MTLLLAFDTATPQVGVALYDGGSVLAERASERAMKHGEQLAPLIEAVLRDAGADRYDLTAIAVGAGPGPFTGLRVGLVTARTLGHVLELPVYGVCSLDVLAVEAVATGAVDRPFVVATDARRKEVYLASYSERGERLDGPVVDRPVVLATDLPAVGEGAALYPDSFPHPTGPQRPSAGWLARAVAEELVELMDPEPLYLRRPDAVESAGSGGRGASGGAGSAGRVASGGAGAGGRVASGGAGSGGRVASGGAGSGGRVASGGAGAGGRVASGASVSRPDTPDRG